MNRLSRLLLCASAHRSTEMNDVMPMLKRKSRKYHRKLEKAALYCHTSGIQINAINKYNRPDWRFRESSASLLLECTLSSHLIHFPVKSLRVIDVSQSVVTKVLENSNKNTIDARLPEEKTRPEILFSYMQISGW